MPPPVARRVVPTATALTLARASRAEYPGPFGLAQVAVSWRVGAACMSEVRGRVNEPQATLLNMPSATPYVPGRM